MEPARFDVLVQTLTRPGSRRALAGLLGGALAQPGLVVAKKKHPPKRKTKVKFNDFGCVNVGNACKRASQCCSGLCQGKKGKKKCQAHDAGGCQVADDTCTVGVNVPCPDGTVGASCFQTTGQAGFCGFGGSGQCVDCATDANCVPAFGAGAACIVCASECEQTAHHTACVPSRL